MSFVGDQQKLRRQAEVFSGNGVITQFALSYPGMNLNGVTTVDVRISGVTQPTTAYGITNQTITFTSAPPIGTNNIEVVHQLPVNFRPTELTYIQTLSTLNVGVLQVLTSGTMAANPTANLGIATKQYVDAVAANSTGGAINGVFYENSQNVTANYTITTAKSAMSTGPITINSGFVVTIPSGSRWVIL